MYKHILLQNILEEEHIGKISQADSIALFIHHEAQQSKSLSDRERMMSCARKTKKDEKVVNLR